MPIKARHASNSHHMPYPIAPQPPDKEGDKPLSSIQVTPPGGLRLLTPSENHLVNHAAGGWSPDGRRVVYAVNLYKDEWDIFVMNRDGSDQKALTHFSVEDAAPRWSPDGEKIIFSRKIGENWDLLAMNRDGSDPFRLTTHPAAESSFGPGAREIRRSSWSMRMVAGCGS